MGDVGLFIFCRDKRYMCTKDIVYIFASFISFSYHTPESFKEAIKKNYKTYSTVFLVTSFIILNEH